jgi:hypothetical protein
MAFATSKRQRRQKAENPIRSTPHPPGSALVHDLTRPPRSETLKRHLTTTKRSMAKRDVSIAGWDHGNAPRGQVLATT